MAALATTTPAQAESHSCVLVGTATFSPTVTSQPANGTITLDCDATCAEVAGSGGTGIFTGRHSDVVDYEGGCLTAGSPGVMPRRL